MTTVTLTDKLSNSLDNTVINYFDSFADTFNLAFDECCKLETPKCTKRTMQSMDYTSNYNINKPLSRTIRKLGQNSQIQVHSR